MKEIIIFLIFFLIIFSASVFVFNGKFIYAQIKYSFIGVPPVSNWQDSKSGGILGPVAGKKEVIEKKEYVLPKRIAIPTIGIEAPVIISQGTSETDMQKDLEKGVIYLPGSSTLNEKGTMVIMGHSSAYPWYKGRYGSIFALLNKLNVGDEIDVFSKDKTYTYRVVGKEIKAPKDLVFQTQEDEAVLYLVSCWPINTAWKRIVIKTVQTLDKNY
jgi:LPXTG-site transpeptidase (sortase) family protein